MKTNIKRFLAVGLGIFFGMILCSGYANAATGFNSPGNPDVFDGNSGNRVSGAKSGKFGSIQQVGMEIIRIIEIIVVPLIMALALLAFLWGVLQYIKKGGDPKEREQGRQFMLWGIIGLAVMASVWGLVRILTNTLGVPLGVPSLDGIK